MPSEDFKRADGMTDHKSFCEHVAQNELRSHEPPARDQDHLAWRLHRGAMFLKDAMKGQQLRPHRGSIGWRVADSLFTSNTYNGILVVAILLHMLLGFLEVRRCAVLACPCPFACACAHVCMCRPHAGPIAP